MKRKVIAVSILGWAAVFFLLSMMSALSLMAQSAADPEAARAAQIAKARKALAGTAWTVYTTLEQEGIKKPEEGTEVFSFSERRVTTQNLASQGYAPDGSNYSVRYEADGVLVWETMQNYKGEGGGGEALLRGDLKDNLMVGVIDIHPAKGPRKIYRFTSQKEKPKAVTKKEPTADESASIAVTTVKTTTTTTKTKEPEKKKGGWW